MYNRSDIFNFDPKAFLTDMAFGDQYEILDYARIYKPYQDQDFLENNFPDISERGICTTSGNPPVSLVNSMFSCGWGQIVQITNATGTISFSLGNTDATPDSKRFRAAGFNGSGNILTAGVVQIAGWDYCLDPGGANLFYMFPRGTTLTVSGGSAVSLLKPDFYVWGVNDNNGAGDTFGGWLTTWDGVYRFGVPYFQSNRFQQLQSSTNRFITDFFYTLYIDQNFNVYPVGSSTGLHQYAPDTGGTGTSDLYNTVALPAIPHLHCCYAPNVMILTTLTGNTAISGYQYKDSQALLQFYGKAFAPRFGMKPPSPNFVTVVSA